MEVESQQELQLPSTTNEKDQKTNKALKRAMLILNFTLLLFGASCTPLALRLYFVKGGSRKWLSSWLQTIGCVLILIPLSISSRKTNPFLITLPLFTSCAAIGLLVGLTSFLYAQGVSYLPVSTSALLISTQLGFTAFFAFLIVKQKFTAYSVNAVVLLSFGAVVLGTHSKGDRPKGESRDKYSIGFVMMLAAAGLNGLVLPLVELVYRKVREGLMSYRLVMEIQLVMGFFATVVCTVGMLVNKDFQAIPIEAKEFELGETGYYLVLVSSAIFSQFLFLGTVGVIHCASALLAGIIIAVLLPVTEVLAVIFFHEPFTGGKGIALALSVWGFVSYFYGEVKANKTKKSLSETNVLT